MSEPIHKPHFDDGWISIEALIADLEQDPEMKRRLDEARMRLYHILYKDEIQ